MFIGGGAVGATLCPTVCPTHSVQTI